MIKKLTSLFVLMIFILSIVPLAIAEDATTTGSGDGTTEEVDSIETPPVRARAVKPVPALTAAKVNAVRKAEIKEEVKETTRELAMLRAVKNAAPAVKEKLNSLSDEEKDKLKLMTREKLKEMSKLSADKIKTALQNKVVVKVKEENLYRKRVVAEEKLKAAEKRYQNAKENLAKARNSYEKRKNQFNELKDQIKACEGVDSDECTALEAEILAEAKALVIDSADVAVNNLEQVKERVNQNDDISDEDAEDIIADLDAAIKELEDAKADAEAAVTKEEVQEAARIVNSVWKRIRLHAENYAVRLANAKVGEIVVRSEHLESRLECILDSLEEQGIEVEDLQTKVDKFSELIDLADTKFGEGKALYEEAKALRTNDATDADKEKIKELSRQARELVKEAHKALQDAHRVLTEILKDIRSAGGKLTGSCNAVDEDGNLTLVVDENEAEDIEEVESDDSDDSSDEDETDEEDEEEIDDDSDDSSDDDSTEDEDSEDDE